MSCETVPFIWVAPTVLELNGASSVLFKVTTAGGRSGGFRNNQAMFSANSNLPSPTLGNASATPPPGTHDTANAAHAPVSQYDLPKNVRAHGWFMTLAWGVFIPIGVWAARYGKAPPGVCMVGETDGDGSASPSAWARSVRWIRSEGRWFKIHRACTMVGVGFFGVGFVLMYHEVDTNGGAAHFKSTHAAFGAAAAVLGLAQPLNAYFRPAGATRMQIDASAGKSTKRVLWEMSHRITGSAGLLCSVFAVTSGFDRARVWGEAPVIANRASDAYAAWLFFICLFTVNLEILRRKEQMYERRTRGEEFKEDEMGET